MLTKLEEEIISNYVDEYIDDLRMDVVILDRTRIITEQSDSRILIVDKDFVIDKSKEYNVVLRNPVEEYFFIPKKIDYYETRIDLEFERENGFRITNFADEEVIVADSVQIVDPRITDNLLRNIVSRMCFDIRDQESWPEIKTAIDEFFSTSGSPDFESLKNRIGPFLGVQ